MTDEEKCEAGVYDSVNVVIIRLKKILSDYKISKKVRNSLEDIRDNNWQGKNDRWNNESLVRPWLKKQGELSLALSSK